MTDREQVRQRARIKALVADVKRLEAELDDAAKRNAALGQLVHQLAGWRRYEVGIEPGLVVTRKPRPRQ